NSVDITRPSNREPSSSSQWSEFPGAGHWLGRRRLGHGTPLAGPSVGAGLLPCKSLLLTPLVTKRRRAESRLGRSLMQPNRTRAHSFAVAAILASALFAPQLSTGAEVFL